MTAEWKEEWKTDVVYLHVFPREMSKCVPNLSPFAIKLETWLRMKKIAYEIVDYMGFSSKGQSPFIFFNKKEIPDTNFIIEFLSEYFKLDPYEGVCGVDRAVGRAFLKMIEENTTWPIFWYRYVANMSEYRNFLKFQGPEDVQDKTASNLTESVGDRARKHGIGRHSNEEIYKIGSDDIRAISAYLADKPYLLGESPTLVDCSLFGVITQITCLPMGFPMKSVIEKECGNILAFVERVKSRFWPHWDQQHIN